MIQSSKYYELIMFIDEENGDYLQGLKISKDKLVNFVNDGQIIPESDIGRIFQALLILIDDEIKGVEFIRKMWGE